MRARARWPKGDVMNSTACEKSSAEELGRDCCIRGYHVYKEMWEAAPGEVLECVREPHNVQGRYAVTAKKNREQSWNIYHEGCRECVRSSCDDGARHPVQ